MLDASIVLDLGREGYTVEVNAQTQGVLGTFFPWQTLARSDGRMNAGEAEPRTHRQTGTWRGKDRAVSLYYDGSGSVLAEVRPPDDPAEREPVPPEMVPGTTDPLSAVLSVAGAVAVGRGCSETVPVFDGRRRYDLTFQEMGSRNLAPSKYSVFSGAAVQCQVTSKVLAGNWKKDGGFASDDEKRKPVALMLASGGRGNAAGAGPAGRREPVRRGHHASDLGRTGRGVRCGRSVIPGVLGHLAAEHVVGIDRVEQDRRDQEDHADQQEFLRLRR